VSVADHRWAPDGEEAQSLRRRAESLWNRDYFDRVVVPLLDVPADGGVLDVGTGFGAFAFLLHSARPDLFIAGIDTEPGLVGDANLAARSLRLERVRFEVGDAAALPYDEGTFDLVTCQTLLAHVPDARVVVAEMARVLKPGGVLFIAEWTDRSLSAMPVDNVLAPRSADTAEIYRLTKAYSEGRRSLGRGDDEAGLRAALYASSAGLEVEDVRYSDRLWHAIPRYRKPSETEWLESARSWTTDPVDQSVLAWAEENIKAAGGTAADVERYVELTENPSDKEAWRNAMEAGRFAVVSTLAMILTFARKPL
jgi:ubiquinone/menaquinone biosynthesis C-methylase UbiE